MATTTASVSIRSSAPIFSAPIQLTPLESSARESVAAHIERHIGTNWRISHHLNADKDAQLMSSVPIYVWQRTGRNRAGLLLLRADEPAIFWNLEQDQPYTLKLQVPATLTHKGTCILIATISKVEKIMTIEDVWTYEGRHLLREKKYSERWPILQSIFETLNKQQYFLGADLQLIEPLSFNEFIAEANKQEQGTVWEFQPDVPLRRRLVWMIPGKSGIRSEIPGLRLQDDVYKTAQKLGGADDAVANEILTNLQLKRSRSQMPVHTARIKPTTQPQARIHKTTIDMQRCALLRSDKTTNLPDSYILEADGNSPLGRICVPRLAQSQELKKKFFTEGVKELLVDVLWNSTFKKYEVLKILPSHSLLSPASMFHEIITPTMDEVFH
jgi:hypothetical protein